MQSQSTYRIQNSSDYKRAFIQGGSITVLIDEKAIKTGFVLIIPAKQGDLQYIPMKLS